MEDMEDMEPANTESARRKSCNHIVQCFPTFYYLMGFMIRHLTVQND